MQAQSILLFRMFITVLLCAVSIHVILSRRFTPTQKHWAYGTIGTLIGYWLKL